MESFEDNNKREKWNVAVREIETTVDRLGESVEGGIKNCVIALRVNGFGTKASCEGHLDRGYPYPWIDVASTLAEADNHVTARFHTLKKALAKSRQPGGEGFTDAQKAELQELINAQTAANEEALERLLERLNEFNESVDENLGQIELVGRSWSGARLQPIGVFSGSIKQLKEEKTKIPPEQLGSDLTRYQLIMNQFAKFLESKFFN